MIFQPGNDRGRRWPQGVSGNPAGRAAGFPTLRKQAVSAVMQIVDEVLTDPANRQRWRRYVQEKWTDDPGAFLREIVLPLSPRESLTLLRTTENGLAALTVNQLKVIAATLPENATEDAGVREDTGNVIDVEPKATEAAQEGKEQAGSVPAGAGKDFDAEAGF